MPTKKGWRTEICQNNGRLLKCVISPPKAGCIFHFSANGRSSNIPRTSCISWISVQPPLATTRIVESNSWCRGNVRGVSAIHHTLENVMSFVRSCQDLVYCQFKLKQFRVTPTSSTILPMVFAPTSPFRSASKTVFFYDSKIKRSAKTARGVDGFDDSPEREFRMCWFLVYCRLFHGKLLSLSLDASRHSNCLISWWFVIKGRSAALRELYFREIVQMTNRIAINLHLQTAPVRAINCRQNT